MSQLTKVPMNEHDILRLRANGLLTPDETAYFLSEIAYAENMGTGVRRRLFVEGLVLESRRTLLHD